MTLLKSRKNIALFITAFALLLLLAIPAAASGGNDGGFVHGPTIDVDGVAYYIAPGAPDSESGAPDIPGHYWRQVSRNQLLGKHYNTGPFGMPQWWSSTADDGQLLYIVRASIDTWSPLQARLYARRGYVHYHELVRADDWDASKTLTYHPTKVVWLRHVAVDSFNLDGGPHPELGHEVTPGLDRNFIPNGMMPYNPDK
jgi:selenium-binding protein 1